MDRGAWQLQSMGSQRVGHDQVTKCTQGCVNSCFWQCRATSLGDKMMFGFQEANPDSANKVWMNWGEADEINTIPVNILGGSGHGTTGDIGLKQGPEKNKLR